MRVSRVLAIGVTLVVVGCKSAYPTCSSKDRNVFRCNQNTIEMCDGRIWHPQYSCAEDLTDQDGEPVIAWCESDKGNAICVAEGEK